jgi:hypothetical protein
VEISAPRRLSSASTRAPPKLGADRSDWFVTRTGFKTL